MNIVFLVPCACEILWLTTCSGQSPFIFQRSFHFLLFMRLFQMLVCTVDGDLYPPLEEQTVSTDPKANKKKDKDREKKFIWNHGSK